MASGHDFTACGKTLLEGHLASEHDFTACGKTLLEEHMASEHDFTACGKTLLEGHMASEHDFTACGKTLLEGHLASGHDFSRADNANKIDWALAPEAIINAIPQCQFCSQPTKPASTRISPAGKSSSTESRKLNEFIPRQ